ncbi:hypothetical protein EVAR_51609_1 [Eumeta japonica]|uniref:Nucleic-acid-binding protein from transposon X-element n=1 Tax=Eumeta variegata TaxID=151549 RepID=A0A4C1YC90_EUMVA|nr:hypothetical protein EVAR_51609_1 [Eumeta japonica]
MGTFRRHLKKQESTRSGAGSDDIYEPIWFAYAAMESFLLPVYTTRNTINTETGPSTSQVSKETFSDVTSRQLDETFGDETIENLGMETSSPSPSPAIPIAKSRSTSAKKPRRCPAPDTAEHRHNIDVHDVRHAWHRLARRHACEHLVWRARPAGLLAVLLARMFAGLRGTRWSSPTKKSVPGQCFNCQLYGHSSKNCFQRARCVKCLGDNGNRYLRRAPATKTDGPPACVLCKSSSHTANYLDCLRAPKRKIIIPKNNSNKKASPRAQTAQSRTSARGRGKYVIRESDGGSTPKNNVPSDTSTEDIKVLLSMIFIIDIGEIALLAKKFKAAANPVKKILLLAEHAPLVEVF